MVCTSRCFRCPSSCPMTASTSSLLRFLSKPSVTATRLPVIGEPYAKALGNGILESMSLGMFMPLFTLRFLTVWWSCGLSVSASGLTL